MRSRIVLPLLIFALAGCSSSWLALGDNEKADETVQALGSESMQIIPSSGFIHQFVDDLGSKLVAGVSPVQLQNLQNATVAIGSFVTTSDLESSNPLGRQIQEGLYHSLNASGLEVVDFKLTDFVRVTPDGDWVATRNYTLLSNQRSIDYFVYGSMTEAKDGVLVQARMVNVVDKNVVATSQSWLSEAMVEKLQPSVQLKKVNLVKR